MKSLQTTLNCQEWKIAGTSLRENFALVLIILVLIAI